MNSLPKENRLIYLDWLKVLAVLFVFFIHSVRFFDFFEWYIKNDELSLFFSLCSATFVIFIMPLFFFFSGASLYLSMNVKTPGQIMKNRSWRLIPPLIIGIFILSPHQVYFERLSQGKFSGSFIEFMPHYFEGWYGFGGNFAWPGLHLWYLLYLYVFTLIALPFISRIHNKKILPPFLDKALTGNWAIVTFIIIQCIPMLLIPYNTFIGMPVWGTWNTANHFISLLLGYYCYSRGDFAEKIKMPVWLLLLLGLLFSALAIKMPAVVPFGTRLQLLNVLLRSIACWMWVFALLKIGRLYLNYKNKTLVYTSDAALPVYILHQPVIVLIGFFIIPFGWNMFLKFFAIVVCSEAILMFLYHFIIRKYNWARILMGLPPRKRSRPEHKLPLQPMP